MTNLKNLLFKNIQNILMTCCQVSDRCPLGYLFFLSELSPLVELSPLEIFKKKSYLKKHLSYKFETWSADRG